MATAQQVMRLGLLAVVIGVATTYIGERMIDTSPVAGIVAMAVGLALGSIGIWKVGQAANARG